MPDELILTKPYDLRLAPYVEAPLAGDEVRAQAVMSAISHGTELNLYRGTSPFHDKKFDSGRRIFVAGEEISGYPTRLGYEWVGKVSRVGEAVSGYSVGDLVHLPLPHRQTQTFRPAAMAALEVLGPLPPSLQPEPAAFLSSVSIALQAVHDAHLKVGDHVVVFGLGTLGLLTVQLARLNGAGWIDVVDPLESRRVLAQRFGADRAFDPLSSDVGLAIKDSGPGADVAIEFSGNYQALHQAMRSLRLAGLVVAAGFYQGGAGALRLGEEWLHNRLTMVASSRGWGSTHRDHPTWDRKRLRATAINVLERGDLKVDGLISHRFPFERAGEAYELIDSQISEALKVVLTYSPAA